MIQETGYISVLYLEDYHSKIVKKIEKLIQNYNVTLSNLKNQLRECEKSHNEYIKKTGVTRDIEKTDNNNTIKIYYNNHSPEHLKPCPKSWCDIAFNEFKKYLHDEDYEFTIVCDLFRSKYR